MSLNTGKLLTVADLDSFPDDGNRYELIAGELFVSRAPGIPQQLVLQNLLISLAQYLKLNPCGRVVSGAGAVFSDYDAVIPDLVFVSVLISLAEASLAGRKIFARPKSSTFT